VHTQFAPKIGRALLNKVYAAKKAYAKGAR
jgi:hypothetical protein